MGWGGGGESCLRVAVRHSRGTVCVAVVVQGVVVRNSFRVCILSWGGRPIFLCSQSARGGHLYRILYILSILNIFIYSDNVLFWL